MFRDDEDAWQDGGDQSEGPYFEDLEERVLHVFVPSAPINEEKLFAGRSEQLRRLRDAIKRPGQHAVIYGERGVGKTSIVSILPKLPDNQCPVVRENCHSKDSFGRMWLRAFRSVQLTVERQGMGFAGTFAKDVTSLARKYTDEGPRPDEVVHDLRYLRTPLVFVFDEFDQIEDTATTDACAGTIKALSDHSVPATIIVVGVGDSVDLLIRAHTSIERATAQIRMPRMPPHELSEIVVKGMRALEMRWEAPAIARVVGLSQGLPHYVHLLALHATQHALGRYSLTVTLGDVDAGIPAALQGAAQSLRAQYGRATTSNQKSSLFKHVLLACALTRTDELGLFAPSDVREPLRVIGKDLDISSHIQRFATEDRGNVLQRVGPEHRYRYRFRNPLFQPFVLLRGISEGLIRVEDVDALLSSCDTGQGSLFGASVE